MRERVCIQAVCWTPSPEPGYARYFLQTAAGTGVEVTVAGLQPCAIPPDARSLDAEFAPVVGVAAVVEVRTDDRSSLAILLEGGWLALLTDTFEGENPGNNFFLQAPAEFAEWREDYLRMRVLPAPG